MVFSSLLFLFRFLPAVLILYFIVPKRFRNLVLLLVSLIFYAWGEPKYVFLMLFSILITYLGGFMVDRFRSSGDEKKAKISMIVTVALALSLLGFFKYADFVIETVNRIGHTDIDLLRLSLPIGISFYTFQTISYVIDVYRGDARVQKNIISYGAYVTMFPQLIAGPIVRYSTIDEQLRTRRESAEEFAGGAERFVIGLGKKVLLANSAGALWDSIRVMDASTMPALTAWLGIAAYTFQIYFDFSAYSDMAIGLGHMFGFRFLENFNYPYQAKSVTEFWRRWHISLGTWFREYVYIPLGGNRVSRARFIRNIMIVWMLTGIWHGADWNFVLWGIYYGVLLLVEKLFLKKYLEKTPGWLQHVYTMFTVMIGWFIFTWNENESGFAYLKAMFGMGGGFADRGTVYLLYTNAILLVMLILGSTDLPARLAGLCRARIAGRDTLTTVVRCVFLTAVFLLSTAYLVNASYNPFLYFRF